MAVRSVSSFQVTLYFLDDITNYYFAEFIFSISLRMDIDFKRAVVCVHPHQMQFAPKISDPKISTFTISGYPLRRETPVLGEIENTFVPRYFLMKQEGLQ